MSRCNSWKLLTAVLAMVTLGVGCDSGPKPYQRVPENVDGIGELASPLTALTCTWVTPPTLTTHCGFVASTGLLTLSLAAGEVAVVSKHPVSGAILVNDVLSGAMATTIKNLNINAVGADHTVILDFANGVFAPGISGVNKEGIKIDWGTTAGINTFKLRGSSTAADAITMGTHANAGTPKTAISFNSDAFADIVFAPANQQTDTFTFSLGGGNDVFVAGAVQAPLRLGAGYVALASAVTVYGGAGDDSFQGGLGNDIFYGDTGSDTFKGGPAFVAGTKTFIGGTGLATEIDTADYSLRPASESLVFQPDGTAASGNVTASELNIIMSDVEVLKGGAGDDTFVPDEVKGHAFYGGAGVDRADYAAFTQAFTVTMGDKLANDGLGTPKDDIREDVEQVKCPAADACTVTGNALDNTFIVPVGSTAGHSFLGLTGNDTVDFTAFDDDLAISMDGLAGTNTYAMKVGTEVENIKCPTGVYACTIVGNAAANHIWGGGGLNNISSGLGDDTIESVGGSDIINCGVGSDILLPTSSLTTPAVACELYDPPPTVTAPASVTIGASATLTGFGFATGATVTIGGQAQASVTFVSSTTLTIPVVHASTPTGAQNVVVTSNSVVGPTFSVTVLAGSALPTPTVTAPTPTTVTVGGSLAITGTNFTAGATVDIGAVAQTVVYVSATSLTIAAIDDLTVDGNLVVTVPGAGAPSTGYAVTVDAPTIDGATPSVVVVGRNYVITGTGFTTGSTVAIGAVDQGAVTFNDSTSIEVTIDAATVDANLVVTTAAGASAPYAVTVGVAPTITTTSPGEVALGAVMTITGTGFAIGATTGSILGVTQVVTCGSTTSCTITVDDTTPVGVGNLILTVGGVDSDPYGVTIIPVVTGPANFTANDTLVVITGKGFTANSIVKIDGVTEAITSYTSTTITLTQPSTAQGNGASLIVYEGAVPNCWSASFSIDVL